MKSALQTVSQESSRPDSDLAIVPPVNVVIELPQPSQPAIGVHNGKTVQWRWTNNFSVDFDRGGVFKTKSVNAQPDPDGLYWTTPPLLVVGPPFYVTICTYNSLSDAMAADTDPPPPPPNVVIVDNSGLKGSGEK